MYPIMPKETFHEYLKVVLKLNEISDDPNFGLVILKQYKEKWENPLTLKEIVSWVPKKFLHNIP
jgi:methyltransferase-like protein